MRTFTLSDATSHKFWNIELTGTSFTVTYGKIGTKGQSSTKVFPTEEKALKEYEKLVKEKVSKGYVETTPSSSKSPRLILEESLIANPGDATTHAAYADLLTEEGDPRGEFIQVQLRLEDETVEKAERERLKQRDKELEAEHQRAWLGALAPTMLDQEGIEDWMKDRQEYWPKYKFEKGLLREINFPDFGVTQARLLLASTEQTRFVRTLRVGQTRYEDAGDYEAGPDIAEDDADDYPGVRLLAKWKNLPSLHVFEFGEGDADDGYSNCHTDGELAHHFVKQMPHLEELYLMAHRVDANSLFALPMPNLRVLKLYHSHEYPLKKLADNPSLGKLEQMLFHPHAVDDDMPYGLADLRAVVKSPHLKSLTNLRMRLTIMGDAAIEAIVSSGILKRLRELDLANGTVSDEGAKMLADCPDAKNLKSLNLNGNELTDAGIQVLKSLGVPFTADHQHESTADMDEDDIRGMEFLFNGDME